MKEIIIQVEDDDPRLSENILTKRKMSVIETLYTCRRDRTHPTKTSELRSPSGKRFKTGHPDGKRSGEPNVITGYRPWFPSDYERCACCDDIKTPDADHTEGLLLHCRTKRHVTKLVKKHGEASIQKHYGMNKK